MRLANRFERIVVEDDFEQLAPGEVEGRLSRPRVEYYFDRSQSLVSENNSPDIPFRYSVNPYRGCVHGCSYCYARPTHEYLGFNAGDEFESRVLVKADAPALLRKFLSRRAWRCEMIMFSGVTDCCQPAERQFRLTRSCLEVARDFSQPVAIVTKNALVARDRELLAEMSRQRLANVAVSLTTLDAQLAGGMEPGTSTPVARLRTIRELREAGVSVQVMIAPIIPGLNDSEVPKLLEAVAEAGAQAASFQLLRLPLTVRPVFMEWLQRTQPLQAERVEARIRDTRGGALSDARFGSRMAGEGEWARQIKQTFDVFARKHGLDRQPPPLDTSRFRVAEADTGQLRLF
ncbi:MAG: PA0069 family radical SAM protein [Planctomycetales bacterium]|nr:PA0069 family radical SAM protein [Planctomycetales bacterium]